MKAKVVLAITLAIIINSFAGIKEYLDNSVIIIENQAGSATTDTRNIYFGGGYKIKTPTVNFQPFTVVPPSFRAGCGGIDITFGAFSYFNVEYLVNFLKAVTAQAPAFAFKTAIATLCPQCSQLMDNLTALANAINGLNFNSCQVAQRLGGSVGKWFGKNLNETLGVGDTGPDWLKSFNEKVSSVTSFINNDVKNLLTSQGCNAGDRTCFANFIYSDKISLLDYLMVDMPYIASDTNFQNILRSMIGDIVKRGSGDEDKIKYKYIPANVKGSMVSAIIDGLAFGDGDCLTTWTYDRAIDKNGKTVSATTNTICDYVKFNIDSIVDKLNTRQPLNTSDLQFLAMFKAPVYQIFNVLSLQPGALERAKPQLIKYLSYQLTYDILSTILSDYSASLTRLKNAEDDGILPVKEERINEIQRNIVYVLQATQEGVYQTQDDFQKQIKTYFDIQRLRGLLMANLARHPVMDSRLYTKALLGF